MELLRKGLFLRVQWHFDRFLESQLGPAVGRALGDRAREPERSDQELHTFYTRP